MRQKAHVQAHAQAEELLLQQRKVCIVTRDVHTCCDSSAQEYEDKIKDLEEVMQKKRREVCKAANDFHNLFVLVA